MPLDREGKSLEEMLRDVFADAKTRSPGSLDYSLEMLAEMRLLRPQPNTKSLFGREGFHHLQFVWETNKGDLDETPIFGRLSGTPKFGPVTNTMLGVSAVSELRKGQYNVGCGLLFSFLDAVGPVPHLIGAFASRPIENDTGFLLRSRSF